MEKPKENKSLDLDFFEYVILKQYLTDNKEYAASTVDHLDNGLFNDRNVRAVFRIVTEYYIENNAIPSTAEIKSRLSTNELRINYRDAVMQLVQVQGGYNNKDLLNHTEEWIRQRTFMRCMHTAIESKEAGKGVPLDDIYQKMEAATAVSLIDDLGIEYFTDLDQHIEQLSREEKHISTGWGWLDDKLGGGWLQNGRALYVFSGVTNVGKSIFLGNVATNALAQNKTVVVISLEMSEHIYASRFDAQLAKIAVRDLSHSGDRLKSTIGGYKSNHPDAKLWIKEFPPSSVTARHIAAYIKKLQRQGVEPDMIVLDYLSLLLPTIAYGSSYMDVKKVSEQVRALSYQFECPVITATQLNRNAFGVDNPGMEMTSESMGLSMTVDAQFGIWTTEEDTELGLINLGMMKNRFGQAHGSTALQLDFDTLSLTESLGVPDDPDVEGLLNQL